MRLAMSGDTDEDLKFAVQMGATDVVGGNGLPTDKGYYTGRRSSSAGASTPAPQPLQQPLRPSGPANPGGGTAQGRAPQQGTGRKDLDSA